ncbi:MAG: beta-hydroxyacyl-ACP dehydratase [Parabacteroides sp.]|nr:beta-hydroxyacyl-ACP dehydratase [Parabacteroides sp.]
MLLENYYYQLIHTQKEGLQAVYRISILPDCSVYQGHFPDEPICPGVCNIETIKECAMHLTGKELFIHTIKLCRLTAIASPTICPEVTITLHLEPIEHGFTVTARIADENRTYMEYKGDMLIVTD